MTLTAPGGISNSSSKKFSNLFGRISMDNYNIIIGSKSSYDYYADLNKKSHKFFNKYPEYKPKSIEEVIKSTGLIK
jgi:hypothetical protein